MNEWWALLLFTRTFKIPRPKTMSSFVTVNTLKENKCVGFPVQLLCVGHYTTVVVPIITALAHPRVSSLSRCFLGWYCLRASRTKKIREVKKWVIVD